MTPKEEFTLMKESNPRTIVTTIKNGRTIKWINSWDYKDLMTELSFKTTMTPPYQNENMKVETIDLKPMMNIVIYKITIKR